MLPVEVGPDQERPWTIVDEILRPAIAADIEEQVGLRVFDPFPSGQSDGVIVHHMPRLLGVTAEFARVGNIRVVVTCSDVVAKVDQHATEIIGRDLFLSRSFPADIGLEVEHLVKVHTMGEFGLVPLFLIVPFKVDDENSRWSINGVALDSLLFGLAPV